MPATLDRLVRLDQPPVLAPARPWRDRLQPLVSGSGGWGATLLVTVLGGLLRFLRLDLPGTGGDQGSGRIFDEIYYACDAQNLLRYGVEHASAPGAGCVPTGGGAFIVHPPLGKWAIAVGEQLFGVGTFGWRFSAAVAGTLTILLVVRIGRRMTGSTLLGGLAGVLLSLDGLWFVQSRIAMLDVFLVLWVVAAFGALVVDRDALRSRLARASDEAVESGGGRLLGRPWRVVAGACAGAAVATKWSGLYPLAVLPALALAWEVGARRTAGVRAPFRVTLRRTTVGLLLTFVVLPVAVYTASWAGWFASDLGWDRHWADTRGTSWPLLPDALRSWWHYHRDIYHFHSTLAARHPYQSHPGSWLVLGRPVSYYYPSGVRAGKYGCQVATCSREVLAIGTPAIWWALVPASLGLLAMWVARRDWRASSLLVLVLAGIVPWIPSDLQHRTMFLFYALPAIPFLCLGLALLAGWALGPVAGLRRSVAAVGVGGYTALVAVNFVWLYPVLAAQTIPYSRWLARMWFRSWI